MMSGGLSEVTTGMYACLKAQEERIRDSDGSVRVMRAWEEPPLVLDIPGVVFRHILLYWEYHGMFAIRGRSFFLLGLGIKTHITTPRDTPSSRTHKATKL